MIYFCSDQFRRSAVRSSALNGIDFIEVIDHEAPTEDQRQRLLTLHFVNDIQGAALTKDNFLIEGGERIRNIVVVDTNPGAEAHTLDVEVDKAGDFSKYTLRLIQDPQHLEPPAGYDPRLAAIDFSFKVECPSDFDCKFPLICPVEPVHESDINYLAKDYASFRQLMLDRMALLLPQWTERNPADMGIALIELLANVGDYLSYQQDAVATEGYLRTSRRRTSVRRHAMLVDYHMHNGCNARAWVQIQVETDIKKSAPDDPPRLPKGTPLFTGIPGQTPVLPDNPAVLQRARVVYETIHAVDELFIAHNNLPFYTWGDQRCCLPKGTTHATLKGHYPDLKVGEVLIIEEVIGPATGKAENKDISRRHAVRLTDVVHSDVIDNSLTDPLNNQEITEVRWSLEDALPFPFCISTLTDEAHGKQYIEDVSVARGNIVLADHGVTIKNEELEPNKVPEPTIYKIPPMADDHCKERERIPVLPRFRPKLQKRLLTHAAPYDSSSPANNVMHWEPNESLPAITLQSTLHADSAIWHPKRDLLSSGSDAKDFVVEVETDGTAYLRFGDGKHGSRPESQTKFEATYRIGNGVAGNIGAEALKHVLTNLSGIIEVRNPLPAQGGVEPESMEDVRQHAPNAFRTQKRAVTEKDYAEVTEQYSHVQKAAATFRWTGSWHTVFLTIDRRQDLEVDEVFKDEIQRHVERFRMAGYDLGVNGPRFVPLEIEMDICAKPEYFHSDVKAALSEVFSDRTLPDGRRGVFHPDNFTFGQPVYLSSLYEAAQAISGVDSAHIVKFQRQGVPDKQPLVEGKIMLNRLEIARLNNDSNYPERGVLRFNIRGGK
jgi:hypothetical protein